MKILLIDNSSLSIVGNDFCVEPKTGNFALELNKLGNEITFYGQKVYSPDTIHNFFLKKNGMLAAGLRRKKNKFLNYILLHLWIIPFIIRSDFVYIFFPTSFKYVSILCKLLRKPYGLYVRGEFCQSKFNNDFLIKNALVIFTVSDYFTNHANSITGERVAFSIRPMIDFTEKDIVHDRNLKMNSTLKILFLARIEEDKGVGELLLAIKALISEGMEIQLTVVGDGGYMQETRRLIKKLDIEKNVDIKGAIFDKRKIKDFFLGSDLYILPSYHPEGFPRTLYESMIFGTPIITTFMGGTAFLMKHGFNCLEIEPKSVESIVNAIRYAHENYPEMIEYTKNAVTAIIPIISSKRKTHAEHLNQEIVERLNFK